MGSRPLFFSEWYIPSFTHTVQITWNQNNLLPTGVLIFTSKNDNIILPLTKDQESREENELIDILPFCG